MNRLCGKKFIASYSGGKDSVLALYRALKAGLLPLELITTHNIDRSWFHRISGDTIQKASDSMGIPVRLIRTSGEHYKENFEKALLDAKSRGAEVCVFGDIDIEGHLEWCRARCKNAGLTALFPLLKEERKKLVYEFIDAGFSAVIISVDTARLSKDFIGRILTRECAESIEKTGADICGENGEYHTFVFDGPIFKNKVQYCD